MEPNISAKLAHEISYYERRVLDSVHPPITDPSELLTGHEFVRVKGIANFWQDNAQVDYMQHVTDLVIGAHGYEDYLTFVMTGTPKAVNLYFSLREVAAAKNLLSSAYPGVALQHEVVHNMGATVQSRFAYMGMISGVPARRKLDGERPGTAAVNFYHLERVMRGMRDATWVYLVKAYPRPTLAIVQERHHLLDKMTEIVSMGRHQVQRSTQASRARTNRQTEVVSETVSGEMVNRQAEYLVALLEFELERLDTALTAGSWQVAIYFGATEQVTARRLGALLTSILAGADTRPDPIRAHFCQAGASTTASQFHTYLSSPELALLVPLLREEAPGYAVSDMAQFDVDYEPPLGRQVTVGAIQWGGNDSGQNYGVKLADLTRHGLVAGVTGSGKTTTLLHLLDQVWQTGTPFLVIEPAKMEYRALLGQIKNSAATGIIPDLRLYTLGNEMVAPFRLNPFEFECSETSARGSVLSHIDSLKAVFNAAFVLYAPMPYLLDMALHEVYEDKGWNLATGENVRLSSEDWAQRHRFPIFPTLTDLYHKVEVVTVRLGYEERIERDVIAGLKARLGSLRLGAKGLMLDTARGVALADLLAKPTVLELENIGNDDEKTFLIGLLLTRIYSYRRLQATEGKLPGGLQHVLVVEEAHRLLKNVSTQVETDSANARAQAIETFTNMLAEVRHYGQGVLVAEQIPSKLTPDVSKNTNLKLVHRLLAQDDREAIGATMNMTAAQVRHLTTLRTGEAVVYAEGDDHPFLLTIADFKAQRALAQPLDHTLPTFSQTYIALDQYLPTPDFATYGLRCLPFGRPDSLIYQVVAPILDHGDNRRTWARLIARAIYARSALPAALERVRQQFAGVPSLGSSVQGSEALLMWIVLGAAQALQARGADMGWSYVLVDAMRVALTTGLVKLARTNDLKGAASELDRFARLYELHKQREMGPYPGCQACRAICLYHAEVSRLLSSLDRHDIHAVLTNPVYATPTDKYVQLSSRLRTIVNQWLGKAGAEHDAISYCTALVAAQGLGLDEYEQADFARELAGHLLS